VDERRRQPRTCLRGKREFEKNLRFALKECLLTGIQRLYPHEFKAIANPMSSVPLQLVLLFAVAYSQIFGGVSCCCLSRALFMSWTHSSEVSSPSGSEASTAGPADSPKCPKCAASRTSSESGTPEVKGGRTCTLSDDYQCRCAKLAASAGVHTDPFSPINVPHELASSANLWNVVPAAKAEVSRSDGMPVRFGGRSWQSVACVWKN
jgi:hypothetical protein